MSTIFIQDIGFPKCIANKHYAAVIFIISPFISWVEDKISEKLLLVLDLLTQNQANSAGPGEEKGLMK
jgi:hypothetical protein